MTKQNAGMCSASLSDFINVGTTDGQFGPIIGSINTEMGQGLG